MPAFTFEKISSPIRSTSEPVSIKDGIERQSVDRSGRFMHIIGRLTGARVSGDSRGSASQPPKRERDD